MQSELVANEQLPTTPGGDPRVEAALHHPLVAEQHRSDHAGATLVHHTRHSRAARGRGDGPRGPRARGHQDHLRGQRGHRAHHGHLPAGAGHRAARGQVPGLRLVVAPVAAGGARPGPGRARRPPATRAGRGCCGEQRAFLDEFWTTADVEIDGDAELQQAVRVAVFHVLQAGARAERRAIGAKGLTGPGYDGHTFWDTETFCLPVLSHLQPDAAADALRWRQSILPLAHERAEQLGLGGAAFPWRTIRGQECSGYWPAGTAAFHINADIADAVRAPRADHRRHRLRARGRPRAARRHRAAVALAGPPRLVRRVPHRRRDRPRRVHRDRRQQRLHQPHGAAEPPLRRRGGRPARPGGGPARGQRRGDGELARRREVDAHPVRRGARRAPAERGLHPPRGVGLREHAGREVPAAAQLPVLRPVPQAGHQAGRPRARDAAAARRVHPRADGAATSPTTRR